MKNNDLVQVIEDTDEFYKLVSNNVKKFRKKQKYTQLDFSAHIGFDSVSFSLQIPNIRYFPPQYNFSCKKPHKNFEKSFAGKSKSKFTVRKKKFYHKTSDLFNFFCKILYWLLAFHVFLFESPIMQNKLWTLLS